VAVAALKVEGVPDQPVHRVRRPMDLARLCMLTVVLVLLIGLGVFAHRTMSVSSSDLARALNHLPRPLTHLLSFVAGLLIIVLPVGYVVVLLLHRAVRLLLDAVVAGMVALAVVWSLGQAVTAAPRTALDEALRLTARGVTTSPVDAYLAAVAAFGVAGGMTRNPRWRWYYAGTLIVYAASALAGAQASLLALAVSFVAGTAVALALRYAIGALDQRPDAQHIGNVLVDRGISLVRLTYLSDQGGPYRQFIGVTEAGRQLRIVVLDRDLVPSRLGYRIYRTLRVRGEVAPGPNLSMERAAERRSLLAVLAERVGLPTPDLVAGVPCGPDAIVLAYESIDATPIADATVLQDAQLIELWRAVSRMHESRVTHRELTPDRLSVDRRGVVWVASPTDGAAFATNLRINLDRAELLVTTTRLVGAQRAVSVAQDVLGTDGLSAVRPVLQTIGFSQDTRAALRRNRDLLTSLVDEMDERLASPPPQLSDLERVRPRTVLMIVALIIAGYLLIGQLGAIDLATVFATTHWGWAPVVLAGSALTYLGSGLALTGFVREHLSYARTVLTQLATAFTGFVAPASFGVMALNIQYLRKSGVPTAGAATSVAVNQVVGVMSYFVLLILFGVASGTSTTGSLPIPAWAFIVLGVAVALGLLVMAIPRGRSWVLARVLPTVREVLPRLAYTATRPVKLAQGVGGTVILNAGYIIALSAAVTAFGGGVALVTVAVVYLAGGAIGSAAPTPGGLGAVEAAMSAGLTAAGMPGASAVSAVLLYRVATFWLPVPIGWLAYTWMQRRDWL
jgi:glycosyltransferase 2 family protein